jgi:NADPH-dependent 2,4-dienoyl-CoA reductase/sulfur reductase-like enzyme
MTTASLVSDLVTSFKATARIVIVGASLAGLRAAEALRDEGFTGSLTLSIAELHNGEAISVTDYWGEPTATPEWRRSLTGRLEMPADGIWKDAQHLSHY